MGELAKFEGGVLKTSGDIASMGESRIFFGRGCTRLLLYFNTNKPHSFFLQNTSCIRKPQVISGAQGGGVRTPCTLPLDPPLASRSREFYRSVFLGEGRGKGGEDEKVNKSIKILKNVDGTVNLFVIRLICCFKGSS